MFTLYYFSQSFSPYLPVLHLIVPGRARVTQSDRPDEGHQPLQGAGNKLAVHSGAYPCHQAPCGYLAGAGQVLKADQAGKMTAVICLIERCLSTLHECCISLWNCGPGNSNRFVRPAQYLIVQSVSNLALNFSVILCVTFYFRHYRRRKPRNTPPTAADSSTCCQWGLRAFERPRKGQVSFQSCGLLLCVVGLMVVCVLLWVDGEKVVQSDSSQSACCFLCHVG
jgi:hypothetical protein